MRVPFDPGTDTENIRCTTFEGGFGSDVECESLISIEMGVGVSSLKAMTNLCGTKCAGATKKLGE